MWAELAQSDLRPELKYNRANTAEAIFEVAVRSEGHVAALETQREHLDLARQLFSEIGDDVEAGEATRIQALTNLGNSYDTLGRDLDSIEAYERAIEIDPDFGMAQGNKGVALLGVVHLSAGHTPAVLGEAVEALDRALVDRDRVAQVGGPKALARFERERERITVKSNGKHAHDLNHPDPAAWSDPYLRWCRERNLFLHVSPGCLSEDTELLDPLFFSHVVGSGEEDGDRVDVLVDAFDAIKQDYAAARYSAWLVGAPESPIRGQAAAASTRTAFLDSLSHAQWGVRTGMAMQAFTAATNLLDKVAGLRSPLLRNRPGQRRLLQLAVARPRPQEGKDDGCRPGGRTDQRQLQPRPSGSLRPELRSGPPDPTQRTRRTAPHGDPSLPGGA